MAESKYHTLRKQFLEAIRPLIEEYCEDAVDALEEYLDYEPNSEEQAPGRSPRVREHNWKGFKINPESCANAPKRAVTAMRNQDFAGRLCTHCKCVSNRDYPYWFLKGGVWAMRRPPCNASPSTGKKRSTPGQ